MMISSVAADSLEDENVYWKQKKCISPGGSITTITSEASSKNLVLFGAISCLTSASKCVLLQLGKIGTMQQTKPSKWPGLSPTVEQGTKDCCRYIIIVINIRHFRNGRLNYAKELGKYIGERISTHKIIKLKQGCNTSEV